jgi:PAS domain S-box-containing protein
MPGKRSPREIVNELQQRARYPNALRDRESLLHEVQAYQEELTAQNEELLRAQHALEETRDRFIDLYDFAPNGYVTLDQNGMVVQINLTGAAMLGKRRDAIEGMPIVGYAYPDHRPRLLDFLRRCRSAEPGARLSVELTLRTADGAREIQLLSKARQSGDQKQEFFTAMIDVTDRRLLEAEREASAHEHAALASRLISIQDEERHRIARDLHDDVGQQVTALRLILELLAQHVADGTNNGLGARIEQAQRIVHHLDEQLDFLTGELRPVVLDLGAVSAIAQFCDEWSRTFEIAVNFRCDGLENLRMDPDVETHLYRIVQEALNNIAKHAQARSVNVSLTHRDPLLVLTIADDGCGFDLSARARARAQARAGGHGLGLVGMRERALLIRGTVDIQSTPGRGTTITVKLPFGPSSNPSVPGLTDAESDDEPE